MLLPHSVYKSIRHLQPMFVLIFPSALPPPSSPHQITTGFFCPVTENKDQSYLWLLSSLVAILLPLHSTINYYHLPLQMSSAFTMHQLPSLAACYHPNAFSPITPPSSLIHTAIAAPQLPASKPVPVCLHQAGGRDHPQPQLLGPFPAHSRSSFAMVYKVPSDSVHFPSSHLLALFSVFLL